jgi:hypothetical protein
MHLRRSGNLSVVGAVALILASSSAGAQAPGPSEAPPGSVVVPTEQGSVVVTPGTTTTTTVPRPDAVERSNSSLPSSSRTRTGDERDGFDFGPNRAEGGGVVTGNKGGVAIVGEGESDIASARPRIPEIHVVRRGDTLWDLSDNYYGNPWQWPRIWGQNPQITNPHWIYPGDQVRMLAPGESGDQSLYSRLGRGGPKSKTLFSRNFRTGDETPKTVTLRDQGYLGDPQKDTWGEVAGAAEEQMLLAEGNTVYLVLREGASTKPGDELTVFRRVRKPDAVPGARNPPGEIVAINGTVKVDSYDPKTRVARARVTESLDVIERGANIGPVRRRFDVVPPVKNRANVTARVLTGVYPLVYVAANQVVFLDRGSEDGLEPGNRLVVTRRGDVWRSTVSSKAARDRVRMDSTKNAEVETTPLAGENDKFPEEQVAELRVLSTEKYASVALVTQSRRELVSGDVAVARSGF